jgi:predicted transcriptional regulator
MADRDPQLSADLAWIDEQLADPAASFEELRAELTFLRSAAHARSFLRELREGLEDVADGRVVAHEEVVRDLAERRRRRRPSAAE